MTTDVFKPDGHGGLHFVGDFEGLYRTSCDPWGQSGAREDNASYYRFSRARLADALLRHLGDRAGYRLEIGSGHGHVVEQLAGVTGGIWSGLDISATAVAKARALYPERRFYVGDIMAGIAFPPSSAGKYEAVILSQLLWYVLEGLEAAMGNAVRLTRPGGLMIIHQAFLRDQRYGRAIVDGFPGLLRYMLATFSAELRLIEAHYDDSQTHAHHDGLLIFRKVGQP